MARHAAELSTRRRAVAAGLGVSTVLVLAVTLWHLGRVSADGRMEAALDTSPTSAPSTSPPTTAPTTPTTQAPTTPPAILTTRLVETTDTTDPPTTTTTLSPLVLEGDGLGAVELGVTPEEAIAEVNARLGPATADSGWLGARGNFGTCPGSVVRVVRWQSLRLFFSDGPTAFGEEAPHFFYYSQSSADAEVVIALTTPQGIGIGSTVEELTEAYGDRLTIESTSRFGVTFTVASEQPGLLSGILTESIPAGQVISVAGGFGCGN